MASADTRKKSRAVRNELGVIIGFIEEDAQEIKMKRTCVYIEQQTRHASAHFENIGKHLIEKYFDGNPDKALDKSSRKKCSIRMLAKRDDCCLSEASLRRCIHLYLQRETPGINPNIDKLTMNHRLAMMKVVRLEQRNKDIETILAQKMSAQAYKEMVNKRNAPASPGTTVATTVKPKAAPKQEAALKPMAKSGRFNSTGDQSEFNPFPEAWFHVSRITSSVIASLSTDHKALALDRIRDMVSHLNRVARAAPPIAGTA